MTPTLRTISSLALVPAALLLMGSITWGGNEVTVSMSGNEYGSVDYVDATIIAVVSHPCGGGDPVFVDMNESAELVAGHDVIPQGSDICRVDVVLDGFPTIGGTINGESVVETPAVDKLIWDASSGELVDAKIHAGDFGRMSFEMLE